MADWHDHERRETERYREGEARLPDDPDERQRALTRLGNAAGGAGLALLMQGRRDEAGEWLARASERYRESWYGAPPASWGRPIGMIKARLLAGDRQGAQADARWALELGPASAESPIGRYCAALALLTLRRYEEARPVISSIRERDDFPAPVADALAAIAAEDVLAYIEAVEDVLLSFEAREDYLEDLPVADTVLVLQALAADRDIAAELPASPLLPR